MLVALVGIGLAGCTGRDSARPSESRPAPAEPTALPEDIEAQVHSFCGVSCHAYPPADAFPKSHWRMEVERGFRFFDKSGLSLNPPKLGHVVRYYEERARDDYRAGEDCSRREAAGHPVRATRLPADTARQQANDLQHPGRPDAAAGSN